MSLSQIESQIEETLLAYFKAIDLQKSPHPPVLRSYFEKLDALRIQLSDDIDPHLRHFMLQKSYQKALQLLQSRK